MAVTTGPFLNDIMLAAFVVDTTGDTTIETNVRGGESTLYRVSVDNSGLAAIVYIKLWDHVAPVSGTSDPDHQFMVPASTKIAFSFLPAGKAFAQGLSFAVSDSPGTQAGSAPATPPTVRLTCT